MTISEDCRGTFFIEDESSWEEFRSRECEIWWGDLVVEKAAGSGLMYVEQLYRIAGLLRSEDNEDLDAINFASLQWIGGDLMVQNNPRFGELFGWKKLLWVGGTVSYSNNERVRSIAANPSYRVGETWSISGQQLLTFIGVPAHGTTPRRFYLPNVEIAGAFLFMDNKAFGVCRTRVVWMRAIEHAEVVSLDNNGSTVESESWCRQFEDML